MEGYRFQENRIYRIERRQCLELVNPAVTYVLEHTFTLSKVVNGLPFQCWLEIPIDFWDVSEDVVVEVDTYDDPNISIYMISPPAPLY